MDPPLRLALDCGLHGATAHRQEGGGARRLGTARTRRLELLTFSYGNLSAAAAASLANDLQQRVAAAEALLR